MPTETQAVQLLDELGLTEYEARCFVALSRVRKASASEVSDISGVPRSRVYDALERLHKRGLVDVQQSDPRQYQALPTDAAIETLRDRYESTLNATEEALSGLRRSTDLEEEGAWAIADHEHVTNRTGTMLENGEDEIYVLVAGESVLDRRFCDRLADVSDRGARVIVEVPNESTEDRVREDLPSAEVMATALASNPAELEGKRLGRIVMVDRYAVLVSALMDGTRPGWAEETAIWASGPDHGLVVGLRHLLGARLDDLTPD